MGKKRYKGYIIKKEIDNDSINKRNRNISYICLLLILVNLYLIPKYLNASLEVNKPKENITVLENDKGNNQSPDKINKIKFISEGLDIISGDYKDKITDFELREKQLIISYKDEEGEIIHKVDKIIKPSTSLKIMDIELLQDSNVKIRLISNDE